MEGDGADLRYCYVNYRGRVMGLFFLRVGGEGERGEGDWEGWEDKADDVVMSCYAMQEGGAVLAWWRRAADGLHGMGRVVVEKEPREVRYEVGI